MVDGVHRLIIHVPRLHIFLACTKPRFQEIFVKTVAESSKGDMLCAPVTCVGVEEVRVESARFLEVLQVLSDALNLQ